MRLWPCASRPVLLALSPSPCASPPQAKARASAAEERAAAAREAAAQQQAAAQQEAAAAAQQQEQGNAHFRSGQWAAAVASYSEALGLLSPAISKLRHPGAVTDGIDATDVTDAGGRASAGGTPGEPDVLAKLRANRAAALLKLGRHAEAL